MKIVYDEGSGRFYGIDRFGKNWLRIVDGQRCGIPVCDLPAWVEELDCSKEDAWWMVESGEITA